MWFLGPTQVHTSNGNSIGSAASAGLTTVSDRSTNRQTDRPRPRYSVCSNRPQLPTAMRPTNTAESAVPQRYYIFAILRPSIGLPYFLGDRL